MKALDANVLARFFIDDPDDPQAIQQRPAAVRALSDRACVSVTVLLEFEWVMRGFYALSRTKTEQVLRALAGIEHLVLDALDAFHAGLDFADALHLARSSRAAASATFDRRLFKRGKGLKSLPPIELLQ